MAREKRDPTLTPFHRTRAPSGTLARAIVSSSKRSDVARFSKVRSSKGSHNSISSPKGGSRSPTFGRLAAAHLPQRPPIPSWALLSRPPYQTGSPSHSALAARWQERAAAKQRSPRGRAPTAVVQRAAHTVLWLCSRALKPAGALVARRARY